MYKILGCNKCDSEHGMYVIKDKSKGVIILYLYVNDFLITCSNGSYINDFKNDLMKEFEMVDLLHISYFLAMEFQRTSRASNSSKEIC